MGEIKFRAFDKVSGKMYDVGYIDFSNEVVQVAMIKDGICYGTYVRRLKDVALLQYTGEKDKNGKEIYNGDSDGFYIVKNGEFPVRCHETCEIIDRAHGWYLDPIDKSTEPSSWEIPLNDFYINRLDAFDKNIYDNPELLEN
ncbi:YopX family protein [Bacillus mycoides]|uniref:YopX protein domain-containing protein n=1 Tax=Bacillus mycoides TaxID=1405 RepID=A0A4U3A9W4_BACMY|nr:YopX family protein [Bacillus mycoides]TKI84199.1 hypothetical protein FC701_14875 [Bacillus mycoides]